MSIQKSPEVSIIVDFVKSLQPKHCLEIGANYGRELKQLEGFSELYGIDKDASKVKFAKSYTSATVKLADASALPYRSEKFDFVYSSGVFAHNSPEKVKVLIDELYRVSRKHILLVEYIGSHLSKNSVANCKSNTWIHDYDLLVSKLNVNIKYNQKKFFGTDCFQVILMEKVSPAKITVQNVVKPRRFILKLGKFKLEIL